MKKVVENSFAVTGFVGKDAEIRQFTTASVARFPLAVRRKEQTEKNMCHLSFTWKPGVKMTALLLSC